MPTEYKVEGAVDLKGKTSFREALSVLNRSLSFVGVVSSLLVWKAMYDNDHGGRGPGGAVNSAGEIRYS